jgi:hypothetical protein
MLRHVVVVRTDVLEELHSVHRLLVMANVVPSSPILVTLMMKHRFLQEPHGVTSQKMAFFKLNNMYFAPYIIVILLIVVLFALLFSIFIKNFIPWRCDVSAEVQVGHLILAQATWK